MKLEAHWCHDGQPVDVVKILGVDGLDTPAAVRAAFASEFEEKWSGAGTCPRGAQDCAT